MNFLTEFLHQEVPKSGKEMPEYYRKALFISELILAAFFLLSSALLLLTAESFHGIPVIFLVLSILLIPCFNKMSAPEALISLFPFSRWHISISMCLRRARSRSLWV